MSQKTLVFIMSQKNTCFYNESKNTCFYNESKKHLCFIMRQKISPGMFIICFFCCELIFAESLLYFRVNKNFRLSWIPHTFCVSKNDKIPKLLTLFRFANLFSQWNWTHLRSLPFTLMTCTQWSQLDKNPSSTIKLNEYMITTLLWW